MRNPSSTTVTSLSRPTATNHNSSIFPILMSINTHAHPQVGYHLLRTTVAPPWDSDCNPSIRTQSEIHHKKQEAFNNPRK